MNPSMKFEYLTPITIEETGRSTATISGTLLVEGLSRNRNWYNVASLREIAESVVGVPIYYGTMTKIDPSTGLRTKNMHANTEPNRIGKIIKTILNRKKGWIKFFAEITNTRKFPQIVQEVKKGFGISIGGNALNAKYEMRTIRGIRRLVTKIAKMIVNHVQLIPPTVIRGQKEAKVESIEIQESMSFIDNQNQLLTIQEIGAIVGALEDEGLI